MVSRGGGKKKPASGTKKPKAKSKPKAAASRDRVQRMIDEELPGYVVVESAPRKPAGKPARHVGKTASLDKLKAKFSVGARGAAGAPAPKPAAGHGRIVRVRPARGSLDPAGEIGEKAVYLGPSGKVEFRQG